MLIFVCYIDFYDNETNAFDPDGAGDLRFAAGAG